VREGTHDLRREGTAAPSTRQCKKLSALYRILALGVEHRSRHLSHGTCCTTIAEEPLNLRLLALGEEREESAPRVDALRDDVATWNVHGAVHDLAASRLQINLNHCKQLHAL